MVTNGNISFEEMKDKIFCEDCLIGMQRIPDGSIDAVICDPPYEISRDTNFSKGRRKGTDADRFRMSMDFGEWDGKGGFDIGRMCRESYRVLKKGGYFICFYDIWKITMLYEILRSASFKQIRLIEWVKTNPVPVNSKVNYLTNAREIAVCAVKGARPVFNSVYDNGIYTLPIYHGMDRIHPTQKPVDLMRALVRKHTNKGDVVLDCCIGGGTTAIACIKEKRHFIGFELSKDYYDKACKRIAAETSQLSLF